MRTFSISFKKKSEKFCGKRLHFKKDCAMILLVTGGAIKQRGRAI